MAERRWWVRMTVSTYVEAETQADAMQQGCDLLHEHVKRAELGIHDVFACPSAEGTPDLRELPGGLSHLGEGGV